MRENGSEPLILEIDRRIRKRLPEMFQKHIYILGGFRRSSVHIDRITDHKAHYILIFSIFFKIIYYLCRMYRLKCRRKYAERIAYSDSDPLSTVIYAYNPIH